MSCKDYLEKVMKSNPRVTEFLNPILASGLGLGCDALSAYAGYSAAVPGFPGAPSGDYWNLPWLSFPGGNTVLEVAVNDCKTISWRMDGRAKVLGDDSLGNKG